MKYVKKITPFLTDKRGEMSHILNDEVDITSILIITSKKDSVRANHYHKKDIHYVYLISGKIRYSHKDLKTKDSKDKSLIVNKGYLIHTPAMTVHAMEFLEDSVFLAFSIRPRGRKEYEKDTVRVEQIK